MKRAASHSEMGAATLDFSKLRRTYAAAIRYHLLMVGIMRPFGPKQARISRAAKPAEQALLQETTRRLMFDVSDSSGNESRAQRDAQSDNSPSKLA